jgi:hypothetical protein
MTTPDEKIKVFPPVIEIQSGITPRIKIKKVPNELKTKQSSIKVVPGNLLLICKNKRAITAKLTIFVIK